MICKQAESCAAGCSRSAFPAEPPGFAAWKLTSAEKRCDRFTVIWLEVFVFIHNDKYNM